MVILSRKIYEVKQNVNFTAELFLKPVLNFFSYKGKKMREETSMTDKESETQKTGKEEESEKRERKREGGRKGKVIATDPASVYHLSLPRYTRFELPE